MGAFSVRCPHCQARLSIKGEEYVGKRAKCPRCQQLFVIQAPWQQVSQPRSRSDESNWKRSALIGGSAAPILLVIVIGLLLGGRHTQPLAWLTCRGRLN